MDLIKIGKTKYGYTNFYDIVCPHCHKTTKFSDYISDIDYNDTLSQDGSIVKYDYKCPHCNKSMTVTLDVLCNTERTL